MDLLVVMAQRKERYPGEYAPEALAVLTEFGNYDNPEYLRDVINENRESGEFVAVELVRLKVDDKALNAVLFPQHQAIPVTVVGETASQ